MNRTEYLERLLLTKQAASGVQSTQADAADTQRRQAWAAKRGPSVNFGPVAKANKQEMDAYSEGRQLTPQEQQTSREAVGWMDAIRAHIKPGSTKVLPDWKHEGQLKDQIGKAQRAENFQVTDALVPWGMQALAQSQGGAGALIERLKSLFSSDSRQPAPAVGQQ